MWMVADGRTNARHRTIHVPRAQGTSIDLRSSKPVQRSILHGDMLYSRTIESNDRGSTFHDWSSTPQNATKQPFRALR